MKKTTVILAMAACAQAAFAQGTAFTYQGRLGDGGNSASGNYDLRFTIYDSTGGVAVMAGPITNAAVNVAGGLFTATLDFGANAFNGEERWIEIGVRTNGTGTFVPLSPRQRLAPTPYALFSAASGSVNNGALQNPTFIGTTANTPLYFYVNNQRALRLEPTVNDGNHSNIVNVVNGSPANYISPAIYGATISGGGAGNYSGAGSNSVTADFGTVGGGRLNTSSGFEATVGGGYQNTSSGADAFIGGGRFNISSGQLSTVVGGLRNVASGGNTFIGGGDSNTNSANGGTIGGGTRNLSSGLAATIGGGSFNTSSGDSATIGGGFQNTGSNSYATVGGGYQNFGGGQYATIAGGSRHTNSANFATIGGGNLNMTSGNGATVPGGTQNRASGLNSFAAGNRAKADHAGSFVWGDNTAADIASTEVNQFLIRAAGGVGIGPTNPQAPLHVSGGGDADLSSGGNFISGSANGQNIVIDNNEIISRNNSAASDLVLNFGSGNVGIRRTPATNELEVAGNASKTTAGGWLANSDARIKTDVRTVTGALDKLAGVRLVQFHYTDDYRAAHPGIDDRTYLNVVAQEFQKVFPDHVKRSGEKLSNGDDILQVDTYPLTIYSAAAVQELNRKLKEQGAELRARETELAALKSRVSQLEELKETVIQLQRQLPSNGRR